MGMGATEKRRRQRARLAHRQRWKCYFCGVKMTPVPSDVHLTGRQPATMITYEHWDSRLCPERGKHPGEYRNVASCYSCNNNRAKKRELELGKEAMRQRAEMGHILKQKRREFASCETSP